MEKSVGAKLKECRLQRQWSQQELAGKLHVTRQAVSNWERDKTLPDIYMIKEIAAVFEMTLDEYMEDAKQAEVKMPKTPSILTFAMFATFFLYLIIGSVTGHFMVELAIEMVIISVFCQGFVHLFLGHSIKSGNLSVLAGYDPKVEYRMEEVKNVLIQMDIHISCASFGVVMLLGFCAFLGEKEGEITSICLLLAYCMDYTIAICLYNYRGIERTMVKEKDQKTAKAGYVSLIWFMAWIFLFVIATVVKFELQSIENNSPQSIGYLGWFFLFLFLTIAELFYEQFRAKKEISEKREYRPGKSFWVSTVLAAALTIGMFLG